MDLPFNPFVCSEANGIKRARQQEANGAPEIPDTDKPKSKKPKSKATPSGSKDGEASFKGYSLCDLPQESWPQPGKNNGQHGYTLRSSNGGVTRTLPGKVFHKIYIPQTIHYLGGFTTLTCLPHLWAEAIEVLLKSKAFVVKRVGGGSKEEDHAGVKGQYTWSKHGGVSQCWDVVRKAACWPNAAWLYIAQWFGFVEDSVYDSYTGVQGLKHFLKSEVHTCLNGNLSG